MAGGLLHFGSAVSGGFGSCRVAVTVAGLGSAVALLHYPGAAPKLL